MSGSRVLQLEQNICGYAHYGLHCCISRTRNICHVSATYMMVAWRMQRTRVASALTTCVRHHDTTHMHAHKRMPLLHHVPASDHSRSLNIPSSLPHMSTHPALHDAACLPHVHGRRHTWGNDALIHVCSPVASSPGLRQPPFLGRHAALAGIRLIGQTELAG